MAVTRTDLIAWLTEQGLNASNIKSITIDTSTITPGGDVFMRIEQYVTLGATGNRVADVKGDVMSEEVLIQPTSFPGATL